MSKADLIKSLNSKIGATEAQKQKHTKDNEEEKYHNMDINALAEEKLQAGKYAGKTCKTVYESDAQYVKWLAEHQGDNVKFMNLMVYATRMIPKPSPTTPQSSGSMQMHDVMSAGSFADFLEADPGAPLPGPVGQMVLALQDVARNMKQQVEQLEQANQTQQQAIYQCLSQSMAMQEQLEDLNRRLTVMEQNMAPELK
ncbi:unnamed protein product [Symbiodinium necroappetens]|uniref:Uncharacterized protein n=1 Tax=Symbiodinium necroappetens TaxID=1628268 RepID=A0A812K683_9DINO|nr:unnamed protein product [Symbiodinium necroappetens]